jgi:hypothetical protein
MTSVCANEVKVNQFTLNLEKDNSWLPNKLSWNDIDILNPEMTMNFSWTDYMYRTKYYREDNKHLWGDKPDKRFVVDIKNSAVSESEVEDSRAWQVSYISSYAAVKRDIRLHKEKPEITFIYQLEFSKDILVHELMYFGLMLNFAPEFTEKAVKDINSSEFKTLEAGGFKKITYFLTLLNGGPLILSAPDKNVSVLIDYKWDGDLPAPEVTNHWQIKKGQKVTLIAKLTIAKDKAELLPLLKKAAAGMKQSQMPFQMFEYTNILVQQDRVPEAEKVLLKAADLNKSYSLPFSRLAQLRRNPAAKEPLTTAECFTYASYRQPYNYGWSLSGIDFPNDKRLTEEERRLAIFNLLISVENCQFYADYYVWVARHFEKMKMYVQAAAMTRQALWALEYLPRPESYKGKHREKMQKKLKDLEKLIINQPTAELPPLTEVNLRGRKMKRK